MISSRILILAPHPDDETVGCCAAIRRARASGAAVRVLFLTTGVPRRELVWPWQRGRHPNWVATRREEARAAARALEVDPEGFLDIPTRCLRDHIDPAIAAIRRALAKGASTLWVPAYEGAHQDHDVTHYIASQFRDSADVWEYAAYNFSGGRVRSQAFPDADGLETVLTLSQEEARTKRAVLAIYRSERGNLRHIATEAESFRPYRCADYSRPPHPGTLFYARFQWVPFRHPGVDFTPPEVVRRAILGHRGRAG